MRLGPVWCGGALFLLACGGSADGGDGVSNAAFAGTIQITSPLPVGAACEVATTRLVTFGATGADTNAVTLVGGGCLEFVNDDVTTRKPGPSGANLCDELTGPALTTGQRRTAGPFDGPQTCLWQDELHPPPAGGGGGH